MRHSVSLHFDSPSRIHTVTVLCLADHPGTSLWRNLFACLSSTPLGNAFPQLLMNAAQSSWFSGGRSHFSGSTGIIIRDQGCPTDSCHRSAIKDVYTSQVRPSWTSSGPLGQLSLSFFFFELCELWGAHMFGSVEEEHLITMLSEPSREWGKT